MNNEKNVFEVAVRGKFRFPFKGLISTEDLWDLTIKELDSVFKVLNSVLKQVKEESLLETKTQQDEELDMKIQIVKHIVEVKLEEEQLKTNAKKQKEQKQRILEIINNKQNIDLQNKSVDELQKMLNDLDN